MRATWAMVLLAVGAVVAQDNLVANADWTQREATGFPTKWNAGSYGKLGQTVFFEPTGGRDGGPAIRLRGTAGSFTTCAAPAVKVTPGRDYWVTWWFRAEQPPGSRSYLFLQTNLAQRAFPQTDQRGDFPWTRAIVPYRAGAGETSLSPTLTMHTPHGEVGSSWWAEVGVYEQLPPELEAAYRREHPWDEAGASGPRVLVSNAAAVVWGDRAEARIYPQTPVPAEAAEPDPVVLTAPGGGHDLFQLVVSTATAETVELSLSAPSGPGTMPPGCLRAEVVGSVPVSDVRDKSFPLGLTPDPLLALAPQPAEPGRSAIFWVEWEAPADSVPGLYQAEARVTAGGRTLATVPLTLRRWAFNLPTTPPFGSMVLLSPQEIIRFEPSLNYEQAARLGWDMLAKHRLSGFNLALAPVPAIKDGKLVLDWTRFDRMLAAAKEYGATALTIGPCFGGGAGQGWKPAKFAGLVPLADPEFDAHYVEFNRQVAERLRQAGLLDRAYVYPYDEPEADYMDQVARLCDLIHQGDPELKILTTTDPMTGRALWGKVDAWIIPSSILDARQIAQRRAAGDEIWIYNMTAAIEADLLAHRLYPWRAMRLDAAGALLWNANWWHKINPWENPTAEAYPVGRSAEGLYRYQAGQASLFYPPRGGEGGLVRSLRLPLIRQGVEDFELLTTLLGAWRDGLPHLSEAARQAAPLAEA
ncbi:MAG: DUF4091 domain-containing protein, partial [Armatimonadetes bacterium]|nr:DUF4091 domain-containing protein [Armatimonadota bacterium]